MKERMAVTMKDMKIVLRGMSQLWYTCFKLTYIQVGK